VAKENSTSEKLDTLLEIMRHLRDPRNGCPWDLEQNYKTIAPHIIEETYEVVDAIDRSDLVELRDELGDLLFQIVFLSQLATEDGFWGFKDVIDSVSKKMVRRHPNVFGHEVVSSAHEQTKAWESHKKAERKMKKSALGLASDGFIGEQYDRVLSNTPPSFPALVRALRLQNQASTVGFDWTDPNEIVGKVEEEISELKHELKIGSDADRLTDEIGDILFSTANLARQLGVDPETALRAANKKFQHRFEMLEDELIQAGSSPAEASLEEMEQVWSRVKLRNKPKT